MRRAAFCALLLAAGTARGRELPRYGPAPEALAAGYGPAGAGRSPELSCRRPPGAV